MEKIREICTYKRLGLVLIILVLIFNLCCCSVSDEISAEVKANSDELTLPLKMAEVYTQFLKNDDISSDEFSKTIENAKKIAADAHSSDEEIENAADDLLQAIEIFHNYLFEPDNDKVEDINLVKILSINGAKCAYDEKSRTFYYPMGTTADTILEFDFTVTSGFDTLSVFAEIIDSDGNKLPYSFIPTLNEPYVLCAYSDTYTFEYKIMFTMMPIVQVSDIGEIGNDDSNCTVSLTDADSESLLYYESTAQIHIRGSSARGQPKKSYAIKFVDNNSNNKDVSFFGIRKDSHWILDAMYVDLARMRNRVSTDLWLSFSCSLYYENLTKYPVSNGTQGEFVELFVNNEYSGLYCFTTKINRNQLQIKKYDSENGVIHGISYKGKGWEEPLKFKSYYKYNNNSNWWASFQQKYPNPDNGYPIDWEPLYNLVKFVVDSDDETFKNEIGDMIDIDNFVDYTIFLCFSYAHDNTGKNAYWSVYDIQDPELSKFFITVWDVKSTWGRSWDSTPTSPDAEWMDSAPEHDTAIFRRLVLTNANGFADKLKARWEEVKTSEFSPEAVKAAFTKYFDLFESSGAFEREANKWKNVLMRRKDALSALDAEKEYIFNWIDLRYEYINDFIMNKLDTVSDFEP